MLFWSACSSLPKILIPPPQDFLLLKGARQLTFEGSNDSPHFSRDGDKILFTSSQRASHKNTQVYEFVILRNTERRITFQDGEVKNPAYIDSDQIVYASTTDEIKENLTELINSNTSSLAKPSSELYQSDLYGNEIVRLTFSTGYDNEALYFSNAKSFFLFTSFRNHILGIFKYDVKTKNITPFLVEKDLERWSPTASLDQKNLAWLERNPEKKTYSLMLSPLKNLKPRILKQTEAEWRDLQFIPYKNKLIYSAKNKGETNYHIELFDFEKNCTQIVFSGLDSLIQPSFSTGSPDRMAFTRVMKQSRQIYLVDVPSDLGPCLETVH